MPYQVGEKIRADSGQEAPSPAENMDTRCQQCLGNALFKRETDTMISLSLTSSEAEIAVFNLELLFSNGKRKIDPTKIEAFPLECVIVEIAMKDCLSVM
ncbi:hypothetical protein CHS0354_005441 [Potamilus streckersoni]|uniref:Uncharacterized protein n=1 Tax=Potamilus streckersoni TaxID=2493646 RepID=A0AAE0WF82_9BIVA|nr:hypothetical protein CHS0354_005441 [Potamilus streckersoni]